MVSQSARTPESLAIPSHHSPLQTVHKKHENHWRCVPIYQRLAPRLGCRVRALLLLLVVFLSCSSLAAPALVTRAHGDRSVLFVEDDLGSALHPHLTHHPKAPRLMPPLQGHDAIRSSPPSKRALGTDPNASSGDFSVPAAFDSALSNNFTNACAKFLNNMRQNEDFKNCHPFSLLLQVIESVLLYLNENLTACRHPAVSSMPPNPPFALLRHSTRLAGPARPNASPSWTNMPRKSFWPTRAKQTTRATIPW